MELETYSQIYRTYVNELYSYGMSLGYTEDMCMDAIHDVFCKLVIGGKDLGQIRNMKFYLFRSLKNRLLDMAKQGRKLSYDDMGEHVFLADVTSVDDHLISAQEREKIVAKVKTLMDSLTNAQREAIYLRYIQEMEYDDIARLLNITPESVRKLVYRALEKLRVQNLGLAGFLVLLHLLKNSQNF